MKESILYQRMSVRVNERFEDGTVIFTNEEQNTPFKIRIQANPITSNVSFTFAINGGSNSDHLKYSQFLKAARSIGRLKVHHLNSGNNLLEANCSEAESSEYMERLDSEIAFLENIVALENYFGIRIDVPERFAPDEVDLVRYVAAIVQGEEICGGWSRYEIIGRGERAAMSEMRRIVQQRTKSVTVIPQRILPHSQMPLHARRKRRVAAYARVSTDKEEQQTSYEAQIDYYTKYIRAKEETDDWEFVQVYTDEGISALNTKHREGFNAMVQDALEGKIDLIITKSVSRFARNTVDSLTTVRKLKEHGVEVFFEKENIYTLDSKGELLITIMSSLAQEESRSISENTTWGQRKRFADGKLIMPFSRFLGYKRGENGEPEIVPEEAEIVLRIYRMFLAGYTPYGIAKELEADGILSPGGKEKWTTSTIISILTNEKYKGDALLQKRFCVDFITKKMKDNEGEVPQYYVENSHPAIVTKEMFERVQQEMARRKALGNYHRGTSIFAGKLECECCGQYYGRKVWHSTDEHRRVVWRCNLKYKGAEKCTTPHLTEEEIREKFICAYNDMKEYYSQSDYTSLEDEIREALRDEKNSKG